jgi:putative flippase GtrA
MADVIAGAIARVRHLVPELAKFGIVGATGAVVDLGGSAVLYGTFHFGPLKAKAIALTAACVVTYLGSRFWTFRHRENQPLAREMALFIVLNGIGLLIAEVVIAITAYAVGSKDQLAYNTASVIGTGLGTIFRYFAYKRWVFLAPAAARPQPEVDLGKFVQHGPHPTASPVNGHRRPGANGVHPANGAREANGAPASGAPNGTAPVPDTPYGPRRNGPAPVADTPDGARRNRTEPVADTPDGPRRNRTEPVAETTNEARRNRTEPVAETTNGPRRNRTEPVTQTPNGAGVNRAEPSAAHPHAAGRHRKPR